MKMHVEGSSFVRTHKFANANAIILDSIALCFNYVNSERIGVLADTKR